MEPTGFPWLFASFTDFFDFPGLMFNSNVRIWFYCFYSFWSIPQIDQVFWCRKNHINVFRSMMNLDKQCHNTRAHRRIHTEKQRKWMSFLSDLQPLVRHVTNEDVCLQLLHVFEPRHRVGSKAGYTDHPMISELVCRPPSQPPFLFGGICVVYLNYATICCFWFWNYLTMFDPHLHHLQRTSQNQIFKVSSQNPLQPCQGMSASRRSEWGSPKGWKSNFSWEVAA